MSQHVPSAAGDWIGPDRFSLSDSLAELWRYPARAWVHRDLVCVWVKREWSARFLGTALGPLWPFVQPLALFAVYAFVFSELFGMRPAAPDASPALGAVWIFAGVLVWTSFAECISRATGAFFENRNLVQKSSFPADLLVLQPILMSFATLAVGAIVFCVISWFLTNTHPGFAQLALLGVLLPLHFAWMLGLSLTLACAQVILRDTASLLGVVLTVWMFATPIFWVADVASLPAIEPWLNWIHANPMHSLIEAWRWTLLGESAAPFAGAALGSDLARFAPWAIGALFVGLFSARAMRGSLSDEVAS
jgi:lipopolysaccharide transport system permease protein